MAQFTKEALAEVKKRFEAREFIIIDGRIYKRIKYSTSIDIKCENETLNVSVRFLIIFYLNIKSISSNSIKSKTIYKKYKKALIYFSKLIDSGEYIIDSNELYKIYGSKHAHGYINFWITVGNIQYRTVAHKIIYYMYYNIWDDALVIHHKDSNKTNNKIENLELITVFENIIYEIKLHEIPIELSDISNNYYKDTFHLDDEQWKIFKEEYIKEYKRIMQSKNE